jgi:hypothetical protein
VAAGKNVINHKTVTFRQGNQCHWVANHNALEFPDGKVVMLTYLTEKTSR